MRFQTRLTITYAVFILLLGVVIALAYHGYSVQQYQKMEEKNLEVISQQVSNQMDEMIKTMETRMGYILSDTEILESIRLISKPESESLRKRYVENAERIIQKGLNIDYVMNDFFRVVLFNQQGKVIGSKIPPPNMIKTTVNFEENPWVARADAAKGKPVLISAHKDTWGARTNPQVFSLLKAIQGENLGYIEIQRTIEYLQQAIVLPKENLEVMVFLNENELLFSNNSKLVPKEYEKVLAQKDGSGLFHIDAEETDKLLAKTATSAYGVRVIVMEHIDNVRLESNSVATLAVGIAFVFCLVSMAFVVMASHVLAKPLRQLRVVMEHTKLENIEQEINMVMPNNELEALNVSYQDVLERLRESIVKEKRISLLHIQAQFDSLQAQVNPHFLYNVLNVIAQRGMQNGDEGICDLCSSLASMLRYSTDTKQRFATVGEELAYLQQYFYLLKSRYEHKISFKVCVEEEICRQVLPKIALQQISENCINHGFENCTNHMEIKITGWQEENRWYIKIHDNGQGFLPEKLAEIINRLQDIRQQIVLERENMELKIGGMGLVNTYARLLLLYGEELTFEISNAEIGADVLIGANINENGEQYVQSDGGG